MYLKHTSAPSIYHYSAQLCATRLFLQVYIQTASHQLIHLEHEDALHWQHTVCIQGMFVNVAILSVEEKYEWKKTTCEEEINKGFM